MIFLTFCELTTAITPQILARGIRGRRGVSLSHKDRRYDDVESQDPQTISRAVKSKNRTVLC